MTDLSDLEVPGDSRRFVNIGADGTATARQVMVQELDSGAMFGGKTTSSTENTIGFGIQSYTLDEDDGKIQSGVKVEITSLDDTDCWQTGIVLSKDTSSSPALVNVFVKKVSPLSMTGSNWEIQIVDDSSVNIPSTSYSSTSLEFGSGNDIFVGAVVSMTAEANKLFTVGSHIIVDYLGDDAANYFRGVVQSYSSTTVTIFVTDVGPNSSGTYAAWTLTAQDGPGVDSQFVATSITSLTIGTGTKVFTTQAGRGFCPGTQTFSQIYAYDANNSANWMLGWASNGYSGTTLTISVYLTGGSGTIANWIIRQVSFPLGPSILVGNVGGTPLGPTTGLYFQNISTIYQLQIGMVGTLTDYRSLDIDVDDGNRVLTIAGDATIGPMTSGSASNQATMDIDLSAFVACSGVRIHVDVLPATDDTDLLMRFSTDSGSTYDAGASNYLWNNNFATSVAASAVSGSAGATSITIGTASATQRIGNGASEGGSYTIELSSHADAARKPRAVWYGSHHGAGNREISLTGGGRRDNAQDTTNVRFLMSSGNITGTYRVEGIP